MPIYEYLCESCSEKFSLLQSINSSENNTKCPKCSSTHVKKIISSFAFGASSGSGTSSSLPSGGFSGGG